MNERYADKRRQSLMSYCASTNHKKDEEEGTGGGGGATETDTTQLMGALTQLMSHAELRDELLGFLWKREQVLACFHTHNTHFVHISHIVIYIHVVYML